MAGLLAVGLTSAIAARGGGGDGARRAPAPPAAAGVAEEPGAEAGAGDESADAADDPTTRAAGRPRVPTRPTLSEAEYRRQAEELRARYSGPPETWPAPALDPGIEHRELAPLPEPTFPKENPYTKAKAELGQHLFFEPRLSGSGQIACASCHEPELGWADGRAVSFGHGRQPTRRNAPSVFTAAFGQSFFWDGRAKTLEEQAAEPILNDGEMNAEPAAVVARLKKVPEYRKRFKEAFGSDEITMGRVGQAIATFERAVARAGRFSAFDRFLRGDPDALSDAAVRGLHLFRTDARCLNCHNGPLLTDEQFHDVGLSYYGRALQDLGRHAVTGRAEDVGKFKTPSLRNVARTAPYMHNGLFALDGVLNMYNAGMPTLRRKAGQQDDPLFPTKSPLLKPLGLNRQDHADLTAFLESLTERRIRFRPQRFPDDAEGPAPQAGAAPGSPG